MNPSQHNSHKPNPLRYVRRPSWVPLLETDIDAVDRIADLVHTTLPERREVFGEKIMLFPIGCRKLVVGAQVVGYGISHPWVLHSIPPLDEFLKVLPAKPECLYIHDVVVLPQARGRGAAERYVAYIKHIARREHITSLALVSVYGTDVLWARYGFKVVTDKGVNKKLLSYGKSAKYMLCELP